jgi:hypothetical protein
MVTVKRIGPGSAFKVGLVLYGLVGLVLGLIFGLVSLLGGTLALPAQAAMFGMFFGVGAIIILPLCYGIAGGIAAAISAAIYNLVAGWVGGLEVDIS